MADIAFSSVGRIIDVARKIKEAVETVKQNEKGCRDIHRCVARVSALLKRLEETTETMKDEVIHGPLEDLAESIEHALKLVVECQQKHFFRRFLWAGDMAKELSRAQEDIMRKLQLGNFATNIHTTVLFNQSTSAGASAAAAASAPSPPCSPPLSTQQEIIDGFNYFSFSDLKAATEDFSDKNIIGTGGSATVYKGKLQDGQVVAIKELSRFSCDNNREDMLYNVINIFIGLRHKNIVRPLGYCHEVAILLVNYDGKYDRSRDQRFCFVEEYVPNGSLEGIIEGLLYIDWSTRFKIIRAIAHGLCYLHEQCVVHMDIKPSNILLDSDMNPRIGDFGAAEKLDDGDDELTQDSLHGTLGYMAPEYISSGIVSIKCDVYAFGLTLLRTIGMRLPEQLANGILLGTTNGVCIRPQPAGNDVISWGWKAWEAGTIEQLLDASLFEGSQLIEITRCVQVGLLCVEYQREDRPSMLDALAMISGRSELRTPKKPLGVALGPYPHPMPSAKRGI